MAFTDWLILGIFTISTLVGIVRGFLREALSLATLIVAIVVARVFGPHLSALLVDFIEIASLRVGFCYIVVFFGILFVGGLINRLLARVIKISGLGGVDRFLGIFFGLARGALTVSYTHLTLPTKRIV